MQSTIEPTLKHLLKQKLNHDVFNNIVNYIPKQPYIKQMKYLFQYIKDSQTKDKFKKSMFYTSFQIPSPLLVNLKHKHHEFRMNGKIINITPNEVRTLHYTIPMWSQHYNQFRYIENNKARTEYNLSIMYYSHPSCVRSMLLFRDKWNSPKTKTWKKRVMKSLSVKGFSTLNDRNDQQFLTKTIYLDSINEHIYNNKFKITNSSSVLSHFMHAASI